MIKRIQSIFKRLVGIGSLEADRLARAHAIFAEADRRFGEFETPAYLRRQHRTPSVR